MVCATSRDIRGRECNLSNILYELRLSWAKSTRAQVVRFQSDNVSSGNVIRTCGIRGATLDTNRPHKFATVGIFKADNDNLHGVSIGRAHGAIEYDSRPLANRGVCRDTVYLGTQATRLRHVVGIFSDIFRDGDSVRNALAYLYVDNLRGSGGVTSAMAISQGLSENADNGIPRPECRPIR